MCVSCCAPLRPRRTNFSDVGTIVLLADAIQSLNGTFVNPTQRASWTVLSEVTYRLSGEWVLVFADDPAGCSRYPPPTPLPQSLMRAQGAW